MVILNSLSMIIRIVVFQRKKVVRFKVHVQGALSKNLILKIAVALKW